jgi:hypothetical protein
MIIMRRWFVFGSVAAVLGASLVGGCSSSSDPYPDQNTFCLAKAQSECNSALSTSGGIAAACGVSASACTSARQEACINDANAAIQGGFRAYSAAGATGCIAAVQMAYTSNTVPYATLEQINTACEQGVFPGTVQTMGSCTSSDDCSTDATGNQMVCSPVNPGSSVLQCATAIPVAAGGECANFGSQCSAGTYCLGSKDTPYSCQSGNPVGASCTPAKGCGTGAYCSMTGSKAAGTCLAVGTQTGTACTSDVSCGGGGGAGSTPTTTAPYCDLNVPPTMGQGPGACEGGQQFAPGAFDCKAFGATTTGG